ncbi:hypothetical protein Tco_0630250 [Tanacetum coccineum]
MADLKFADTHNLVAFLSKPAESEGFEQIVDFLNANPIRYALTINPTIYISCIEQFWSTVKAKTVNGEVQLHALVDGKKIIITESTVRRDLQLEDAEGVDCLPNSTIFEQLTLMGGPTEHVADETVYKELDDSLVGAATTASILEAEQDIGNIAKTQSKETPNESSSLGTTSGGGPRRQETMGDTNAQTRFENVSKHSNDPLLARVLDLEKTKTTQAEEIFSLKRRVKKLEQKKWSRTHGLKRLYKGRINAIDADEDITLVNDQDDADMFDVNTLTALAALKSVKPKVKANVVEEPSVPVSATSTKVSAATTTTTATIPTPRKGIDKGKGIMVEEPVKSMKKKDQLKLDEEMALKLQAEIDEEERITRAEEENINEANIAWDDI